MKLLSPIQILAFLIFATTINAQDRPVVARLKKHLGTHEDRLSEALQRKIHYFEDFEDLDDYLNDLFEATEDTSKIDALNELAWEIQDLDRELGWLFADTALALSKQINNHSFEMASLDNLGLVQLSEGRYEKAIEHFESALKIAESLNDSVYMDVFLHNLGLVYQAMGSHRSAISFFHEAYRFALDTTSLEPIWYHNTALAESYLKLGMPDSAREFIDVTDSLRGTVTDVWNIFEYERHKAYWKFLQQDWDSCIIYNKRVLGFEQEYSSGEIAYALAATTTGVSYAKKQQWQDAFSYLHEGKAASTNYGSGIFQEMALQSLADVHTSLGNTDSALYYLKAYQTLHDSLLQEQQVKALAASRIRYQTTQKEQQITLLEKDKALAETERQNQRLLTIGSSTVAGLFLLISGLIFRQYREKSRTNQQLTQKNDQIETLIRELHHRVKNNLQMVSSLLSLQVHKINDETARMAVSEGQQRVQAIALLHQKLYQGEGQKEVFLPDYLGQLKESLAESWETQQVDWKLDVSSTYLDIDQAIPVALIVNELVSNSFKYAWEPEETTLKEIRLGFEQRTGSNTLTVSDNGKGFVFPKTKRIVSFGLRLVQTLTKQLEGDLAYSPSNGSHFEISWKNTGN